MSLKLKTLLLLLSCFITISYAQKGKVAGKIEDGATAEELIGVAVGIKGTSVGASTDIEGNYVLSLDSGTYTLVVSYVGYQTKEISGVVIVPGQITSLHVTMDEAAFETEEVVITAEFKKESVDALMLERKNAVSVSDGISADLIRKTPDRNTSDVLKRISGATIQDNKFAVIRGLNERYNMAMLNGAPMPSSEPDRKAFALDIFPSNMIESMTVIKTATPDMPGDFAGGIIKLKTIDLPNENFFRIQIGARANSITTFKDFETYKGGKTDWLGIDDGTRKLPSDFPSTQQLQQGEKPKFSDIPGNGIPANQDIDDQQRDFDGNYRSFLSENSKKFSSNWGTSVSKAMPAPSLQLSAGYKWKNFGTVLALSYTRNIRYTMLNRQDYGSSNSQEIDFLDKRYNDEVLWGGMWNLSYKLSDNHKLSLKNTFNINSVDQLVKRTGQEFVNANIVKMNVYNFTQNRLNSHQFSGEHFLPKVNKLKIEWNVGYSAIRRIIPDYRAIKYQKSSTAPDSVPFQVPINYDVQPNIAGRFFSDLKENVKSGSMDLTMPLPTVAFLKTEIKVGAYLQSRERTFEARQFGVVKNIGFDGKSQREKDSLLALPENQIFDPKNFEYIYTPRNPNYIQAENSQGQIVTIDKVTGQEVNVPPFHQGTYDIKENVNLTNTYTAASSLRSAYVMLDNRLPFNIRATWGFRFESFNQQLKTFQPGNNDPNTATRINLDTTKNDWLPSVNLTYSPISKANIRASYYKTLNRAEFRELAPFRFYDFVDNFLVEGNSNLRRAIINNYDFRLEYFPGAGQVISATVFYKQFSDPIERVIIDGTSTRIINYVNAPSAENIGVEFDARLNLQFISPQVKTLSRITLSGNYSRIESRVDLSTLNIGLAETKRPLQGQSSYIVNAGINYIDEEHSYGVSLLANRVGRRIAYVGTATYQTIWENPRTVLDFQVTKELFKKRFEARFNMGDILAQKQVFYQDVDKSKGYNKLVDNTIFEYTLGRNYSLSLAYRF